MMAITYEGATRQARQFVHVHAVLRRGLERRAGALFEAAENGVPVDSLMRTLREYLTSEILPHAQAEERTLYPAAATQAGGSELVRTLTAEHRELAYLAGRLLTGTDRTEAATISEWIATLFAGHVAKENDLLLQSLTAADADLPASAMRAQPQRLTTDIRVRRVYDEPSAGDGARVLVDRIWPRGLRKDTVRLDAWAKDVAPSAELRTWYQHDPAKFEGFRHRYTAELEQPRRREALARLRALAADGPVTLLTATRELNLSQAAVLAGLLREKA